MSTRPLRLPLPFYESLGVLYVDTTCGDDNNDGLDFRYPKKYILSAYDALPAEGGTIMVADGSYVGGEVSKQGFMITAVGTLYPGWRRLKTLRMVGYAGISTGAQLSAPAARIYPGRVGDVGYGLIPDHRFGIWFTGNGTFGGWPISIENIIVSEMPGGFCVGGNPNPAVDIFGASGLGSDFTTALWWITNCGTQFNGDGNPATALPGFLIGYVIWGNMDGCTSDRPLDAAFDSDRRAGVLVKPSDGSSQLRISNMRGTQGGLKMYTGASTWNLDVDFYQIEGDFVHPLPPAVWLIGTNTVGAACINQASGADAGEGSMNGIVIEGSNKPSQILVLGAAGPPDGPCTTMAGGEANSGNPTSITTPAGAGQMGFVGGRIWGDMDFVRQQSPVISNRVYNLCPQHDSRNGQTGAVTNPTIIQHTPNRVWTQADVVVSVPASGTCVDADVPDKSGGQTAIQLSSDDSDIAYQRLFYAYRVCAVGDIFVCSAWIRFPNNPPDTGFPLSMTLTNGNLKWEDHSQDIGPAFYGDGQWSFVSGWGKITALDGETEALVNFVADNIAIGHPIVIDQRACYHIPADTMSDNEFAAFLQNLVSYVQAPYGVATTQPGQMLIAQGGLGVGNAIAKLSHTLGATANLVPIYDASGALLGYAELKPLTS